MRASLLCFVIAIQACAGGDDGDPDVGPADTGVLPDGGSSDSGADSGVRDTGAADTGTAQTPEITVGDPYGESDMISPAGDTDLFKFQAVAGQWLRIFTRHGNSPVDPVVTLFDSNMTQLGESDDDIPRTGTDSEINFHVPADGFYFLEVQEFSTWDGAPPNTMPEGGDTYVYSIRIRVWDATEEGVVIDPEMGDNAASAVDQEFGTILGTFRDANDVDVYRLRNTSTSSISRYSATILPAGPDAQGSTTPAGRVWITDPAGTTVFARVDGAVGNDALEPPVNPGDYLVWVAHPGTAAGANDYYILRTNLFIENDPEQLEGRNETLAGAELLEVVPDGMNRRAFVLAELQPGDVDYFRFDVMMGEEMLVACGAESSGSGVRGLLGEVRDPMDVMLQSAMEDATGLVVMAFVPTSTGALYVRLSAGTPEPMVTGRWARCGMYAGPPVP